MQITETEHKTAKNVLLIHFRGPHWNFDFFLLYEPASDFSRYISFKFSWLFGVFQTSQKSSEDGDTGSNSSRSLDTGSYHLVAKRDSEDSKLDDLGFDEAKTPSPSPAVVPDSYHPATSPVSMPEKENGGPAQKSAVAAPVAKTPATPLTTNSAQKSSTNSLFSGLSLNVTAQEMRETLARRRKTDPRSQSIDMRKKHDLINNL